MGVGGVQNGWGVVACEICALGNVSWVLCLLVESVGGFDEIG